MAWSEETSECILTIEGASAADAGAYRFDAVNENGSMSVTVMVTLSTDPAPRFDIPPEPVSCYAGEKIRLVTRASGSLVHSYILSMGLYAC